MWKPFRVGVYYFLLVFGAGTALGSIRVLWLAPAVGARAAELIEMPLMLAVMIAASRWIVRRNHLEPRFWPRFGMGLVALGLMLVAEFGIVLRLRGMALAEYVAGLDLLTATVYYLLLGVMAALPLLAPPSIRRVGFP